MTIVVVVSLCALCATIAFVIGDWFAYKRGYGRGQQIGKIEGETKGMRAAGHFYRTGEWPRD